MEIHTKLCFKLAMQSADMLNIHLNLMLWSGGLEWNCVFYGVESWSRVLEWSQILEWQKFLLLHIHTHHNCSPFYEQRARTFATPKFDSTPLHNSAPRRYSIEYTVPSKVIYSIEFLFYVGGRRVFQYYFHYFTFIYNISA